MHTAGKPAVCILLYYAGGVYRWEPVGSKTPDIRNLRGKGVEWCG